MLSFDVNSCSNFSEIRKHEVYRYLTLNFLINGSWKHLKSILIKWTFIMKYKWNIAQIPTFCGTTCQIHINQSVVIFADAILKKNLHRTATSPRNYVIITVGLGFYNQPSAEMKWFQFLETCILKLFPLSLLAHFSLTFSTTRPLFHLAKQRASLNDLGFVLVILTQKCASNLLYKSRLHEK